MIYKPRWQVETEEKIRQLEEENERLKNNQISGLDEKLDVVIKFIRDEIERRRKQDVSEI